MKWSTALILVFAIAFAIFFIGPPFLSQSFGPYPLMKVADVFDIFTPLVLLPIYWLLYRTFQKEPAKLSGMVIFFILAAFWAAGQGMHLSANSIGHLLKGMENSDIYKLTNFYDETLSHYLWHFGVVGLSAFLIIRQWQKPPNGQQISLGPIIIASIVYGFSFFLIIIEGGTAPLGATFAVLVTIIGCIWGPQHMRQQPLLAFFFISYAIAVLFFIGWGIYWRGLPQFSEVGLI